MSLGEIISRSLLGNMSVSPRMSDRRWLEWYEYGFPVSAPPAPFKINWSISSLWFVSVPLLMRMWAQIYYCAQFESLHVCLTSWCSRRRIVLFCVTSADDVMMETVVEVSTECGPMEEETFPIPPGCEPVAKKKRGGQCQHSSPVVTQPFILFTVYWCSVFHSKAVKL